ncbi:MAG: glycosyltransferase [Nanoarchaeota archaeon]|nr:glycosyltransferase [Nanoarchaeota archaeon]MBU1631848.1 glycosyltransferase [Nanoarchaeota archaeon]MBU1875841.1 glycosyltransferase [Nanoarchaeota archaeon]
MFDKKPSVSVIIPAYNEEKYLETTLKSVVNQYYDNLELIVVPNGCTDKTADIAEKFTVNIYETDEKSISLAKNIGYEKASGEVVIFLDADSQMQEGLVDLIVKELQIKYVGGKSKVLPDEDSFPAKAYFGWVNFCGRLSQLLTNIDSKWNNGAGACLFSTHDQLDNLYKKDGYVFRPDLKVMEDVDLISRLSDEGPFKFLTKKGVITSTRRFQEDGYLKRFFMDFVEYLNQEKIDERKDIR